MHFYGSNLGPLARGHLGPWDLGLNKLGKGAPGNATYHMHFYGSNLGPLARGHLGPWDLHLNKLGRGALGNATYQISNIWAKWF